MFRIYKRGNPHKIRDINLAIAYHNTGRTLKSIANEFYMSAQNANRIHNGLVRHISHCLQLNDVYHYTFKKNHDDIMAKYLQDYKKLLMEKALKIEATLLDKIDDKMLVLSSCDDNEKILINIRPDNAAVLVSIEELKGAIRKVTAK